MCAGVVGPGCHDVLVRAFGFLSFGHYGNVRGSATRSAGTPAARRAYELALKVNDQPRIRDDLKMIIEGDTGA